jgi:N-acetylneuraminic acid mutarotase
MIVRGGLNGISALKTGSRYNPRSDSWSAVKASGAPSARFLHAAIWTGSELVIWGGTNTFDWLASGKFYKPGSNNWTDNVNASGTPRARENATAIWTGSHVLIWGGNDGGVYLDDGALLDVGAVNGGKWTTMSPAAAPAARYKHQSVWTGEALIVWGGCGGMACGELYDDGGVWQQDGATDSWSSIAGSNGLSKRIEHTMVWTGEEVIVWGGQDDDDSLDTGGRASLAQLLAP